MQKLDLEVQAESIDDDCIDDRTSGSFSDESIDDHSKASSRDIDADESGCVGMDGSELDDEGADCTGIDLSELLQSNQDRDDSIGKRIDNVLFIRPLKQDDLRLQNIQKRFSTVFGPLLSALARNRGMSICVCLLCI